MSLCVCVHGCIQMCVKISTDFMSLKSVNNLIHYNNLDYLSPNLIRDWSAHKGLWIHAFHHTHTHARMYRRMHARTHTTNTRITGDG